MSTPLTPTQDLIMEVLAARHRLGERMWPFDTKLRQPLLALERRGYIGFKGGIVERTYNVWLSEAGKNEYLDASYIPPTRRSST